MDGFHRYSKGRKNRLVQRMRNAEGAEAVRLATIIFRDFYQHNTTNEDTDSSESGNGWVTMNGTHVLIGEEGEVQSGPPALKGRKYPEAKTQRKSSSSNSSSKSSAESKSNSAAAATSARKAQFKAKLQTEKAELLKQDKSDQALAMMEKGYLTRKEALAAMRDGSITQKIDEYYSIMEESGDPTSEKPLSENKNTNYQDVQSGKYPGYTEARQGYIKDKTGLSDDECKDICEQSQVWVSNQWNKADTAQLDKFIENDHTYDGEIYRGLHFIEGRDEMTFDDFMSNVQVGGTIRGSDSGRNSSWSSSEEDAKRFSYQREDWVDSVVIRCVGNRTSSPIAALNTQGESEVLAHSRAQWTVLNVEQYDKRDGGRHAVITVVEAGEYAPPERGDGIMNKDADDGTRAAKPMKLEDRWNASNSEFVAVPRQPKTKAQ